MFKVGDKVTITNNLRYNVVYHILNRNETLFFTCAETLYLRNKEATVLEVLDEHSVKLDIDRGCHIWPAYLLIPTINYKELLKDGMFGELSDNRVFVVAKPYLVLESGMLMNISSFDDKLYSRRYNICVKTLSEECENFRAYYNRKRIDLSEFGQRENYVFKTVDELKKYYEDSTKEKVIIVYDPEKEDNL